jgi:FKBP-type peptidyl-prolyl cis-trans isomerase
MKNLFLLISIVAIVLISCSAPKQAEKEVKPRKTIKTESGLQYTIMTEGDGRTPKLGQTISVHYIGTIQNGEEFENTFKKEKPFVFRYKIDDIIEGWDEAIAQMSTGSRWEIIVPPALGYGDQPMGKIPANSTLIFTIEILDIK